MQPVASVVVLGGMGEGTRLGERLRRVDVLFGIEMELDGELDVSLVMALDGDDERIG